MKENLKNRFLKYVSFDTQSQEVSETYPSTLKQKELGKYLVEELKNIGVDNAYMDEYGYVYGYLPSTNGKDVTIGLIAHMDTSFDAPGNNIKPNIIDNYLGEKIHLLNNINLSIKEFPELKKALNHTLITTDGTTLLGADDKAGVAIIMSFVENAIKNNTKHPNIIITFTPDEEVGGGTDHFNFEYYQNYNCKFAYTLDGDAIDVINYENFNAASAKVTIRGISIHPGSAKDKMINSIKVAYEFLNKLPSNMVPEKTEDHEGFNHLTEINGSVEETTMKFILRNHDLNILNNQKDDFLKIEKMLNQKYGYKICQVDLKDSYYNMKDIVDKYPFMIDYVKEALVENEITPTIEPIRGGTDGARLTFEGIITPNLGTGGGNYHGPYEYLDLDQAVKMVDVLNTLVNKF